MFSGEESGLILMAGHFQHVGGDSSNPIKQLGQACVYLISIQDVQSGPTRGRPAEWSARSRVQRVPSPFWCSAVKPWAGVEVSRRRIFFGGQKPALQAARAHGARLVRQE